MSEIIGDSGCPECTKQGKDSTQNHLIHFADGGKHCNRCGYTEKEGSMSTGTHVGRTEKPCNKSSLGMGTIGQLKSADLLDRKLTKGTLEYFGVKVGFDEETRCITDVCYPVNVAGSLSGYHVRKLPKDFYKVGETKGSDFFGQDVCQSFKRLWVFEGAEDCMSGYQVLRDFYKKKYPGLHPSCIALSGSKQYSRLTEQAGFLEQFEEVNLCLDTDTAGQETTEHITELHPAWKVWRISENDASDMLMKGKIGELRNALFSAKIKVPDSIVTVQDAFDEACIMPEWGRLWPWEGLNRLTYGRRDGEGIYVGAAVKAGKSEFKNQMAEYIITKENLNIFTCSFEQSPGMLIKATAGKLKHKQFHNPEHVKQGKFTQEDLTEAVTELKGKMIMFNASFADVGIGNMWDRLKPAIRHAVVQEGVKDVFIDPITQLTDGMTPSETETELRRFSNEIQGMAQELGFFYYCFAHLKEPPQGKTHEEGGAIKVAQFRGSRAMAEKTKFLLGIIRNQFSDDVVERNTSTFHLLLNSGFGKSGKFEVVYDTETGSYLEPKNEFNV